MKRFLPVLIIVCGLIIALVTRRSSSESAPGSAAEPVRAASESASAASNEALSDGKSEAPLARIKELEKMALEKGQRDKAAKMTHEARAQVQFFKRHAWTEVIEANRQRFEDLRKEAAQSPGKMVPCTICDGKTVMDLCVVCDHTGKCPTCRGTGKDLDGVCSTCMGSGKCFLCFGLGKMPCPFCQPLRMKDEGVITAGTPDLSAWIPIN